MVKYQEWGLFFFVTQVWVTSSDGQDFLLLPGLELACIVITQKSHKIVKAGGG